MSLAVVNCRACVGIDAPEVHVEVHLAGGLPTFHLVGVPEAAVRESKDRVRSAIQNSGFDFPQRRITVNLSPANVPKEGGRFDLAIALGILIATGKIPQRQLHNHEFYGELSLSGELRPLRGALAVAISTLKSGRTAVIPRRSLPQVRAAGSVDVLGASSLTDVAGYLNGQLSLECVSDKPTEAHNDEGFSPPSSVDLSDVRGQGLACRALEIAAAGGHHLLMIGPPGSGKSMLAARLPTLLPPLSREDYLCSAMLFDVAGITRLPREWHLPTYRAPHHTASPVSIVGGGRIPLPGEISLAHGGVLFLDELPEFSRRTLEVLRQPMEERQVSIARAAGRMTYPCWFQLIAAMNPCPCGYAHDTKRECSCAPEQVKRYLNKVSGPLLDRIDLHLIVPRPSADILAGGGPPAQSSADVRERVIKTRMLQAGRGVLNCDLTSEQLNTDALVEDEARSLLREVTERKGLSARGWFRALKVSRTIADLGSADRVQPQHMAEALTLRMLDLN